MAEIVLGFVETCPHWVASAGNDWAQIRGRKTQAWEGKDGSSAAAEVVVCLSCMIGGQGVSGARVLALLETG